MSKIFNDCLELKKWINKKYKDNKIYVTSGGFDPMHVGHLRCIQGTAELATDKYVHPSTTPGITVIIVNGDGFLDRKKGYSFMPHKERMEIISGLRGVDYVVGWDDGTQTVTGALDILKPDYFTKGGDRTNSTNVPEFKLCEKIGCEVIFNVGGGKIQSSSKLVDEATSADVNQMFGYAIGFADGEKNGK